MMRKVLEKFRTEKAEELERKLWFLTWKNRSLRNLSDYEEEKEAKKKKKNDKKSHRKNRQIWNKNKNIRQLITDTIKLQYD